MAAEVYTRSVTLHIALDPVFVSLVKTDFCPPLPPSPQTSCYWLCVVGFVAVLRAHTCVAEMWYLRPRVQMWRALPPFGTV